MKYEDTVMSEKEIIDRVTDFHFGYSSNRHDLVRDAVKVQAKISFKAGTQETLDTAVDCDVLCTESDAQSYGCVACQQFWLKAKKWKL